MDLPNIPAIPRDVQTVNSTKIVSMSSDYVAMNSKMKNESYEKCLLVSGHQCLACGTYGVGNSSIQKQHKLAANASPNGLGHHDSIT